MRDEILELIRRNRISTTEVADALDKTGVLSDALPVIPDLHRAGVGRAVFAAHASNYAVHEQFRDIREGEVPVVITHDYDDCAVFGELVAKYAVLYRGAEAIVVHGRMRDAPRLRRERFPVWCTGFTPLGAVNSPADPFPENEAKAWRERIDGGLVVCDDAGVVIIPHERLNHDMYDRLVRIEAQEDVWFFCLDTLKWDTKKIVCDKAYLDPANHDRIPRELREDLADFDLGSG